MSVNSTGHLVFLAVDDIDKARAFYEELLGLRFIGDEMGTLLFDMDGTALRISPLEDFKPQTFTVLGWNVADITAETAKLKAAGVEPIRYPGMPFDDDGIANLGGLRILWFADPAGNVLSLTQA
ncbi:MAG: VOC family protein [Chloroflexi bacterium]|nr:VOC family protein [Chloroflexota bacterium]